MKLIKSEVGTLEARNLLLNNIIFSYLVFDRVDLAEKIVGLLTPDVHKEPAPTATLGLFNIKRGNLQRGEKLYNEAISLAKESGIKDKLRQILNFELGRIAYQAKDWRAARSYLNKVVKVEAFDHLKKAAKDLLSTLKDER